MGKLILVFISVIMGLFGYAQKNDTISNPLEKFFQENYDSTVFFSEIRTWNSSPDIYIISKESNSVYYYKYSLIHKNYKGRLLGPIKSGLTEKLNQLDIDIKNNKPEINHFFRYIYHQNYSNSSIWKQITQDSLWNLNDDENLKDSNNSQILNGVIGKFKLITKNKVVSLQYYEPKEIYDFNFDNTKYKIVGLIKLITSFVSDDTDFIK